MLARNPADAVKPPKVERKQMSVLGTDATVELIEAARETPLFVPILLGVRCGLRRGEVVALRWRNVDLERGQISVQGPHQLSCPRPRSRSCAPIGRGRPRDCWPSA
jgi:integrase